MYCSYYKVGYTLCRNFNATYLRTPAPKIGFISVGVFKAQKEMQKSQAVNKGVGKSDCEIKGDSQ